MEIELLRNVKCVMIFLLALPYAEKRKIVPYILLMLLAYSFHRSAILFAPLYFFWAGETLSQTTISFDFVQDAVSLPYSAR